MNEAHEHSSEPAQWLVDNLPLLPPGRALDVAMGAGRNAIFLARHGFQVEGVDISADRVAEAQGAARQAGVTLDARVGDLEQSYHIAPDAYDLIICFNYLQRSLFPQIKAGLRPGGLVVYETYLVDQARLFGKPRNPDFLLRHNELLDLFRDFRVLRYREGIEPTRAIASIVAQKPSQPAAANP